MARIDDLKQSLADLEKAFARKEVSVGQYHSTRAQLRQQIQNIERTPATTSSRITLSEATTKLEDLQSQLDDLMAQRENGEIANGPFTRRRDALKRQIAATRRAGSGSLADPYAGQVRTKSDIQRMIDNANAELKKRKTPASRKAELRTRVETLTRALQNAPDKAPAQPKSAAKFAKADIANDPQFRNPDAPVEEAPAAPQPGRNKKGRPVKFTKADVDKIIHADGYVDTELLRKITNADKHHRLLTPAKIAELRASAKEHNKRIRAERRAAAKNAVAAGEAERGGTITSQDMRRGNQVHVSPSVRDESMSTLRGWRKANNKMSTEPVSTSEEASVARGYRKADAVRVATGQSRKLPEPIQVRHASSGVTVDEPTPAPAPERSAPVKPKRQRKPRSPKPTETAPVKPKRVRKPKSTPVEPPAPEPVKPPRTRKPRTPKPAPVVEQPAAPVVEKPKRAPRVKKTPPTPEQKLVAKKTVAKKVVAKKAAPPVPEPAPVAARKTGRVVVPKNAKQLGVTPTLRLRTKNGTGNGVPAVPKRVTPQKLTANESKALEAARKRVYQENAGRILDRAAVERDSRMAGKFAADKQRANVAKLALERKAGVSNAKALQNRQAGKAVLEARKVAAAKAAARAEKFAKFGKVARVAGKVAGTVGVVGMVADTINTADMATNPRRRGELLNTLKNRQYVHDVAQGGALNKGGFSYAEYAKEAAKPKPAAPKRKSTGNLKGSVRGHGTGGALQKAKLDAKKNAAKASVSGPKPSGSHSTKAGPKVSQNRPVGVLRASGGSTHVVKHGDTLWGIAQDNKTTVSALLKKNPVVAQRRAAGKTSIFSGTKIRIK